MRLAPQYILGRSRRNITSFGGLDRSAGASGAKLGTMLNMTSDDMPSLSTRAPRAVWSAGKTEEGGTVSGAKIYVNDEITAAAAVNGRLCFATNNEMWADGLEVGGAKPDGSTHRRVIVPFGRNFFVVPDGLYAEKKPSAGYTAEKCAAEFAAASAVSISAADADGNAVTYDAVTSLPESAQENDGVVLVGDAAYSYEYKNGAWACAGRVYPVFNAEGIGANFRESDAVILKNAYSSDEKRTYKILRVSANSVTLDAPFEGTAAKSELEMTRYFPKLDFAVENNNRIWGCRYGKNVFGDFVNEIYACSPGDPFSWDSYEGISVDSYTVSLGCPGEFTGAAVLDGRPVFFKENYIITVSGVTPQSFTVSSVEGRGVEKGADKSLVNLNEILFYKNASGITVYDGASVRCISDVFGERRFTAGAAGAADGKYRVVLENAQGEKNQYVYDTLNGVWHIEDDEKNAKFFVYIDNCLYSVCLVSDTETPAARIKTYMFYVHDSAAAEKGVSIFSDRMGEEYGYTAETDVPFFAETRETRVSDGSEVIRSVVIRAEKDADAVLKVGVICGNDGIYREILSTARGVNGTFTVPASTPRCASFRLRFSGKGRVKIISVGIVTEKTGEVNGFGY